MNSKAVLVAVLAMSLSLGDFAFAEGNDRHNERGRNEQAQRSGHGGERGYDGQRDHHDNRSHRREDERRGSGAGPNHNFYRGDRLSSEYRHSNYVVNDWRGHHLSAPPRGYYWVQTGADYVLIAIATGIIAQILLGR